MDVISTLAAAVTPVAIAVTLLVQLVLQIMARFDAARREKADKDKAEADEATARQAQADALKAQQAADAAKAAALLAAAKVGDVKAELLASNAAKNAKLDETLAIVKVVHSLVNSGMRTALESVAVLTRRVASSVIGDEADQAAALEAERKLAEHDAAQTAVDARAAALK